jgi:hypothetical protein
VGRFHPFIGYSIVFTCGFLLCLWNRAAHRDKLATPVRIAGTLRKVRRRRSCRRWWKKENEEVKLMVLAEAAKEKLSEWWIVIREASFFSLLMAWNSWLACFLFFFFLRPLYFW